jgi:hypothetical protein
MMRHVGFDYILFVPDLVTGLVDHVLEPAVCSVQMLLHMKVDRVQS